MKRKHRIFGRASIGNYRKIAARAFLIAVALLIAYLSHQPSLTIPVHWFPNQDKLFHMIEFGGLGFAMVLNRDLFAGIGANWGMLMSGIVWALLDEIHQGFVPGRDSSFGDFAADLAGLAVSILIFTRLYRRDCGERGKL